MKTLLLILSVLFAIPSYALFEARINYGLLQTKPSLDQLYSGASSIPTVPVVYGYGADAIVSVPFLGWGLGLRYESLGFKASSSTLEFKNEVTRTSIVANKRFLDTLVYLGPIFTFGIAHDLSMTVTDNSVQQSKFSSNKCFSYSAGIEGGASLIGLMVGAELGYQSMKFTDATDANGSLSSRDIDMSGTYAKISIGIGI
jgi:hypothetical protein